MSKKPANPNTAYGRKRLREEHQEWKQNLTPEQRLESDGFAAWGVMIVLAVILMIIFLIGGYDGVSKWLSKGI